MLLREFYWKSVYRSDDDDLYNDFYMRALNLAARYDRAVGYFSSSMLCYAAQGIANIIRSGGQMRLIIGHPLEEEEYRSVVEGNNLAKVNSELEGQLLKWLESDAEPLIKYRLQLLSWLVACNKLEIRIALRKRGMYHEKVGIIYDFSGDCIVFQGSANETVNAITPDINYESIATYPSWNEILFDSYGKIYIDGFEKVWTDKQRNTVTIKLPDSVCERMYEIAKFTGMPDLDKDTYLLEEIRSRSITKTVPRIPKLLNGEEFIIKDHQLKALRKWNSENKRGILKLATGSGKTITAIYGAIKLYESAQPQKLFLIVAVPKILLGEQWCDVLKLFGIVAHKCFEKRESWYSDLRLDVDAYKSGAVSFGCAVVVNKTLISDSFQELINKLPLNTVFFIGDECHNHGSVGNFEALPDCSMRMGLSATPYRSDDDEIEIPFPDENKQRINDYYSRVVYEYTLSDAINDKVLTPYNYYVHIIYLTDEETENYLEISVNIAKIVSAKMQGSMSPELKTRLTTLCNQRTRLVGSAQEKPILLSNILKKITKPEEKAYTLFYCGEGKYIDPEDGLEKKLIDKISKILGECEWRSCQFTSAENKSTREDILKNFKNGDIDALVSMRVLDEGIDIPACNTAYILASTKNPRQFIQRRGRILRTSPKKTTAYIHDFVVLPSPKYRNHTVLERLIDSEIARVDEFMRLASNKIDVLNTLKINGINI